MKRLRKEHNVLDSIVILGLRGKIPSQNGTIIATLICKSMVSRKIKNLLSDLTRWIKYRRDERQYKMRGVMFYRIFYLKGHIDFVPPRANSRRSNSRCNIATLYWHIIPTIFGCAFSVQFDISSRDHNIPASCLRMRGIIFNQDGTNRRLLICLSMSVGSYYRCLHIFRQPVEKTMEMGS